MIFATLFLTTVLTLSCHGYISDPPFYSQIYIGHGGARGLTKDDSGDVLSKGAFSNGGIIAVWETDDGKVERADVASGAGLNLNHGVVFSNGFIYASSDRTVYRWPYVSGSRQLIQEAPEVVIKDMPYGGHDTRSLIFDNEGRLYVHVGSGSNVDQNSDRARIRRFNIDGLPNGGLTFNDGEVFADGLRNEVGFDFDSDGVLWGVENGADQANRPDLGGDIHNGNPAEELNKFGPAGTHYGYPYCFSTYNLDGYEAGTQFAWSDFLNDGIHSDDWCKNPANNRPPALAMPAHMAPLGITFYKGEGCDSTLGSFPCSAIGDAFVAFHGSWNSDIPVGYKVAWLPFDKETKEPTGEIIELMRDMRPVNLVFTNKGHLIVSSDTQGELYRVTFNSPV